MTTKIKSEVVVLGSGPGGYAAAFRAADLGKKVTLVERYGNIGGVCLNVGCIPSKALLHIAKLIDDAEDSAPFGVTFGKPDIDIDKVRAWKDSVIKKLTGGLKMLAGKRGVQIVSGYGQFDGANTLLVEADSEKTEIAFEEAVIAVGSLPVKLPFIPDDPRIFDSTGALELEHVKGRLLIIGGGIIGLEMATVYRALGASVNIVEMQDQIIPGADADLVKPLYQRINKQYENIMLNTSVTKVEPKKDGLFVTFKGKDGTLAAPEKYDAILVAIGRRSNGGLISAEKAGVKVDEKGLIAVDKQMRTNVPHIYAIGDVVGQPMLAHKATYEGRLAAEVIAGKKHFNDAKVIPSVAYTDPEVAWVGLTETEAKEKNISYETGISYWRANGRSLSLNRSEGMTKLLLDPKGNVLGAGIVGLHAGDLISELALAIEMGCNAEDIALTIHPHPTLAETVMMAAEDYEGTSTDTLAKKKK